MKTLEPRFLKKNNTPNHSAIIREALKTLGGTASSAEIRNWVMTNFEIEPILTNLSLLRNEVAGKKVRNKPGRKPKPATAPPTPAGNGYVTQPAQLAAHHRKDPCSIDNVIRVMQSARTALEQIGGDKTELKKLIDAL